jgi:hypothetical protein
MRDHPFLRRVWLLLGPVLLVLASPDAVLAQGSDILTGLVLNQDSLPLANVTIEARSLETDIVRRAVTDQDGRFTILFPDGAGQYELIARRIGMIPAETILIRYADEAQLVWNVALRRQAVLLEDIEVTADADFDREALEALLGRELTADELENLPADLTDLSMLALFADGGVFLEGTDSTEAQLAVNGLDPEANVVTIDGVETSLSDLPMEGLEQVEVSTNSFDVADGGFGGAVVAARTRRGTNNVQGSVRYSFENSGLAFGESELSPFGRGETNNNLSGGIGGPLIRNKLFANLSASARLNTDPLRSLSTADATDLQRLGVSPDSVSRVLGLANDYGLIADEQFGTSQSDRNVSAILRLDLMASDRHTLSWTGRFRDSREEPDDQSQFAMPDAGGVSTRSSYATSLTLASQFGRQLTSEFQVSFERDRRDEDPFLATPQARVRVTSELDDGSTGITTLVLGGNTGMPQNERSTGVEISEEMSWLSGGGGHRVRFGGDVQYEREASLSSRNQLGTYTFNSLSDFETGLPASFERVLAPSERIRRSLSYGMYVSDTWRVSSALQLSLGARFDGEDDPRPPSYNPAVETQFGHRTDQVPSTKFFGQSASFTWTLEGENRRRPALIVRGGARLTRARGGGGRYLDNAYRATGLDTGEREINCIGTGVPEPDWAGFGDDAGLIPSACQPGGALEPDDDGLSPTVTVFSNAYVIPKSFRTSLSLQRYLTPFLRASVTGSYARGYDLTTLRDLNLDLSRGFALANESDRPVFVPPSAVTPATGEVRYTDSRLHSEFGTVGEVTSLGASESVQLAAQLRGATEGGIEVGASYRMSFARERETGFDGGDVAGNPNELEWGPNWGDRRHQLSLNLGYPIGDNLEIEASGRFVSGSPYTPTVGSDINGDGERNDRAFVFAPDDQNVSASIAQGMQDLLASTSGSARACLESQFGRIADRGSCRGPWSSTLDFSVTYRPTFLGLNRRLDLNVRTSNFLRGVDDLLHGSDNAHGWGLRRRPDDELLFVTAFDPVNNEFQYAVNERFGVADPRAFASRAPFQLTVSARLQIGSDRRRDAIDRLRGIRGRDGDRGRGGPGRGEGGRTGLTAASFKERLNDMVVNPAAIALELADSLDLSTAQRTQLEALRDSATARRDSIAQQVETQLAEPGGRDPSRLAELLRGSMRQAVSNVPAEIAAVRGVLTDAQWQQMPEVVRQALTP